MAGILSFKTVKKCGLDKISYSPGGIMLGVVQTISVLILFTFVIIYPELFRLIYTISHGRYLFFPGFNYYALSFEVAGVMLIYLVAAMFLGRIAYCGRGNLWFIWLNLATMVSMFLGFIISTACVLLYGLIDIDPANGTAIAQAWDYLGLYWHVAGMKYCFVIFTFAVTGVQVAIRRTFGTGAQQTSGNFGSAKFADTKYLKEQGAFINKAKTDDVAIAYGKLNGQYIGSNEVKDRLVVAPPGEGKSSAIGIPFLLECPHNTFALDIKGELFLTTYKRREAMGKRPVVIDIFNELDQYGDFSQYKVSGFDLLNRDFTDDTNRERYLIALSQALMIKENVVKSSADDHFSDTANTIIQGIIDGNLNNNSNFKQIYDELVTLNNKNLIDDLKTLYKKTKSRYLKAGIALLEAPGDNERGSMKTTLLRSFDWMTSNNVANFFERGNFDPKEFVTGNIDIFLIMPEDMVEPFSRLVRVLIALMGSEIIRAHTKDLSGYYAFVIDEIAQLSYFPYIETMRESGRSRGIRLITIFQSLSQIKLYKKADLFLNMEVKHIFGVEDRESTDWVKSMGGMQTIETESNSESVNQKGLVSPSTASSSNSVQETGVSLIHDNEIREMPIDEQWLFMRRHRPIRCKKLFYFSDKRYLNKYSINPIEANTAKE